MKYPSCSTREISVNLHMLRAIQADGGLYCEIAPPRYGDLVDLLKLGELAGNGVNLHHMIFRADGSI